MFMTYQLLVFGCLSLLLLPSQTLAQAFCAPLASSSSLAGFCLFANAVINENDTGRTNTSSRINITEDLIEFRIQSFSKDVGYAAVGLGSSMSSAEVFVAWGNRDGTVTVSRRSSTGHTDPSLMTNQAAITVIPSKSNSSSTTGLFIATFQRAIKVRRASDSSSGDVETNISPQVQPIIWAWSSIKPESSDPTSPIQYHKINRGTVSINLLASASAYDPNKSLAEDDSSPPKVDVGSSSSTSSAELYSLKIKVHGILMTIAWCIMAPLAIIIARFLKGVFGVWWFRLHLGLMVVGVFGLTGIGFWLVYTAIEGDHFNLEKYRYIAPGVGAAHVVIGLALLVLCTLQVVGGFLIDFLFSPDRKSIPWWDKMHWWMGRFTLIAAIVNIPIGLLLYSNMLGIVPITWSALYALAITISIIVAATFQFKFGQSHHPIDNDKA